MSSHLLLEELGLDYEVALFNVHVPAEFPPEFLELNPNARVPVLMTPSGPIYESAAIMMYLCEKHENRYMPATESAQRGRFLQWLIYLMSTFQPEVLIQFNAERYFPDDEISVGFGSFFSARPINLNVDFAEFSWFWEEKFFKLKNVHTTCNVLPL